VDAGGTKEASIGTAVVFVVSEEIPLGAGVPVATALDVVGSTKVCDGGAARVDGKEIDAAGTVGNGGRFNREDVVTVSGPVATIAICAGVDVGLETAGDGAFETSKDPGSESSIMDFAGLDVIYTNKQTTQLEIITSIHPRTITEGFNGKN
jgi:hypothetical protein